MNKTWMYWIIIKCSLIPRGHPQIIDKITNVQQCSAAVWTKTKSQQLSPHPSKKSPNKNTLPPSQDNLIQNCSVYVSWPDLKCSETDGRNFIAFKASSGFWVKSASPNESFISMISALQQMIKIQSLPFVLKFPRLMGFVWFHLSIQQTAWHISVCFWWFDLSFGQPFRRFFHFRCPRSQHFLKAASDPESKAEQWILILSCSCCCQSSVH